MENKAIQHGMPGEWARVRGTVLSLWPLFVAFILAGVLGSALVFGQHQGVCATLFVGSLVYVWLSWRYGLRRVESFFKGARGEERVAAQLAELPAGYHIFHDFEAHLLHVDHVVVGPTGVYVVETKNWRGNVTVEDEHVLVAGSLPSRSPVRQARAEADAVVARLQRAGWSGTVSPLVCFASNTFTGTVNRIGTVLLVNATDIVGGITARPSVLSSAEVARLVALMDAR